MVKRVATAILVLVLVVGGFIVFRNLTRVSPEDLVQEAVRNTVLAHSYRYSAASRIVNGTKVQFLSRVEGEKGNKDRIHVKGRVLDVDMEVFQIGNTTYNKDPFSHRWFVSENNYVFKQQLFMTEMDPLANFDFSKVATARYGRAEKVNGRKCMAIDVVPQVENKYLTLLWKDFAYTMWIDSRDHVLRKGLIKARSKNNPKFSLVISAEFKDFNKEIPVKPPRI